ncbi:MAG: hypothetical protein JRI71_04690 [Deltaproteobacteria bacterium]|nr:hypothetical protein [Deltaproteobacteria bacterium]
MGTISASAMHALSYLKGNVKNRNRWIIAPQWRCLAGMLKNAALIRLPAVKDVLVKQARRMAGSLKKQ